MIVTRIVAAACFLLAIAAGPSLAAQDAAPPPAEASPAGAALEVQVGDRLRAKYPSLQVLSVTRLNTGPQSLFEFLASGMVGYTDEKVNFVLLGGNLIAGSGADLVNITQERARASATNLVRGLPVDQAIKEVFGKGERALIVFADPDCSFCQAFEKELHAAGPDLNLTIYTFLYPLTEIHPDADRRSRHIACTADPAAAWKEWMLNPSDWTAFASRHPATPDCPRSRMVDTAINIGRPLLLSSTPTLLFHNGMSLQRKPTMEELTKSLDYIQAHPEDVQSLNPVSGAAR